MFCVTQGVWARAACGMVHTGDINAPARTTHLFFISSPGVGESHALVVAGSMLRGRPAVKEPPRLSARVAERPRRAVLSLAVRD